ncbi:MAG: protein tyrosine phosphatase [Gemmatimonadales bacterium]
MPEREKLLFICTFNMSRSHTAHWLFREHGRFDARSAGTHSSAIVRIDDALLRWADRVVVMEDHHAAYLEDQFPEAMAGRTLICLQIPDDYMPMAEDLKTILRERLAAVGIEPEVIEEEQAPPG